MDKIKEHKAIKQYISDNCELLTSPRCSLCGETGEVYSDNLEAEDFCYSCLCQSLRKDPDALKDYLESQEEP